MSFPVLTSVDSPWVVADRSGKCLEIVLPGQQTRFHTVERTAAVVSRSARCRGAPLRWPAAKRCCANTSRRLSRGEPNYDRMTAEVAALTRQQLPFNQAILARLGALRAMSFRGVTNIGQRHLYGPFRQRYGGMADRPAQGRHHRTNCAGSAVGLRAHQFRVVDGCPLL